MRIRQFADGLSEEKSELKDGPARVNLRGRAVYFRELILTAELTGEDFRHGAAGEMRTGNHLWTPGRQAINH